MGDSRQQLVVVQRLAEPSNPVPTPKQDVGHVPEPLQGQQRAGTSSGTRVTPDAPLPSQRPQLCRIHVLPSCGTVPKAADAEGLVQPKKTRVNQPSRGNAAEAARWVFWPRSPGGMEHPPAQRHPRDGTSAQTQPWGSGEGVSQVNPSRNYSLNIPIP